MNFRLLTALGEPNRLRIVELLNTAPASVGEVAAKLGLRQPQATKHLQTLQHAGLVTVHPLGQRRIYALERQVFQELRAWLETFGSPTRSDHVLEQYATALATESELGQGDPDWATGRTYAFTRELPAPAERVWSHWTSAELVRRWWSPEHFEVAECVVEPQVGGRLEIALQEGDGARHRSDGRFLALAPPTQLSFELGPLAPDGERLLSATHDVTLGEHQGATTLSLTIRVTTAAPEAAPALAGIQPGWEQLLDKLSRTLAAT